MQALDALLNRNSVNLLTEPGPNKEQLDTILSAGLRACDHKNLLPWRYLIIEGDARARFGDLMVAVKAKMDGADLDQSLAEKMRSKPFRAPLIVAVAAHVQRHDKVPEIEQVLSAGASAQMMMTAAHALGLGAIWRSGSIMFHPDMRDGLGFEADDQLVGFIYIGTPQVVKPLAKISLSDFVRKF